MLRLSLPRHDSIAGRVLRLPLRLIPRSLTVRVLSGPARGMKWVAGASTHGCWTGTYERDKVRRLVALLSPGEIVFDIGANVGYYSLVAAATVGPAGRVFAFEPVERNLRFLRSHLEINGLKNVEIINAAVSDRAGTLRFATAGSEQGRLAPEGDLSVRVVGLDEEIAAGRLPLADVLKIDVEGAELDVLRGCERLLEQSRPLIFLATHGWNADQSCVRYLSERGYAIERLDSDEVTGQYELLATSSRRRERTASVTG